MHLLYILQFLSSMDRSTFKLIKHLLLIFSYSYRRDNVPVCPKYTHKPRGQFLCRLVLLKRCIKLFLDNFNKNIIILYFRLQPSGNIALKNYPMAQKRVSETQRQACKQILNLMYQSHSATTKRRVRSANKKSRGFLFGRTRRFLSANLADFLRISWRDYFDLLHIIPNFLNKSKRALLFCY